MSYHYPLRAMVSDYARAGVGLGCVGALLLAAELSTWAAAIFAGLAGLFVALGIQAGLRHGTRIVVSERGIRAAPYGAELDWTALTGLSLGYFSLRRDGRRGWMELKLRFGARTLRVDSRLHGFGAVVNRARQASMRAGLALDPATLGNFAALGLPGDDRRDAGEGC